MVERKDPDKERTAKQGVEVPPHKPMPGNQQAITNSPEREAATNEKARREQGED